MIRNDNEQATTDRAAEIQKRLAEIEVQGCLTTAQWNEIADLDFELFNINKRNKTA